MHSALSPFPASRRRLLIVDDNVVAAAALSMTLHQYGHTVEVAHNGADALSVAARFRPDVVFLDLVMPGLSGMEVALALRTLPGLSDVIVAALTGLDDPATRDALARAGFDRHLVKPPYLAEIFEVLDCVTRRGGPGA